MFIAQLYPGSQGCIRILFINIWGEYLVTVLSLSLVFEMKDRDIGSGQSNYEHLTEKKKRGG
jgi:hypothetical protein